MPTKKTPEKIDGLINLGYEAPDYSAPMASGEKSEQKIHVVYPTFQVRQEPAAELHAALTAAKLLDGEFAAIVVLKNSMVRVSDDDKDADSGKDVEMELVVKAIMPHADGAGGETEEAILEDFDKLPKGKPEAPEEE